ncbi:MAG: ABC transporter substrate-binding protein [Myxococcota bacterium]
MAQDSGQWERGVLPEAMTEGTPREGGTLRVSIDTEPPSLLTIRHSDLMATRITKHRVYEMLLSVDPYDHPNYSMRPELASGMPEVSEDGLVHTLRLRRGVRFHDGQPFTARDVIASFDVIRNPDTLTDHMTSYLVDLERYEQVDDFTVRFYWSHPYFLAFDVYELVPILPAHVISQLTPEEFNGPENPLGRQPVGTGPWRFEAWEPGQAIVLQRNNDYWGRRPHLRRVVMMIMEEADAPLSAALRGEIDIATRIPPRRWHTMGAHLASRFVRSRFVENNYAWIGWNQTRPQLSDRRVRQALTMLVDREFIRDEVLQGLPELTECHFYRGRQECDTGVEPWPFDPERAKALLRGAGWEDRNGDGVRENAEGIPLRLELMLPSASREAGSWVSVIQEAFADAGVEMSVAHADWPEFVRRLREHEFDACTLLWGDTSSRTDPTQIWHSSSVDGGSNYVSFRHERADQLMEQARRTVDDAERTRLYQEFGRILHEEQPYTWLYSRPRLTVYRNHVRGVRESLGWLVFRDIWLE